MRSFLDNAFKQISRFWSARTPVSIYRCCISKHGFDMAVDSRRRVLTCEQRCVKVSWDERCESGEIGTHIGDGINFKANELTVRVHRKLCC